MKCFSINNKKNEKQKRSCAEQSRFHLFLFVFGFDRSFVKRSIKFDDYFIGARTNYMN